MATGNEDADVRCFFCEAGTPDVLEVEGRAELLFVFFEDVFDGLIFLSRMLAPARASNCAALGTFGIAHISNLTGSPEIVAISISNPAESR